MCGPIVQWLGHRSFKPETGIRIPLGLPSRAHGSVGERLLHTQEVAGSNPAAPTIWDERTLYCGRIAQRESTCLTSKGSQVQILFRPPEVTKAEPWCSWLAHRPVKPEVAGSSPVGSAILSIGAGIAQLVEHWTENPGVPSSNLGPGTSSVDFLLAPDVEVYTECS